MAKLANGDDNGCTLHADCFTCPFSECVLDNQFIYFHERDKRIRERHEAGESRLALAAAFSLSERSVYRILRTA